MNAAWVWCIDKGEEIGEREREVRERERCIDGEMKRWRESVWVMWFPALKQTKTTQKPFTAVTNYLLEVCFEVVSFGSSYCDILDQREGLVKYLMCLAATWKLLVVCSADLNVYCVENRSKICLRMFYSGMMV